MNFQTSRLILEELSPTDTDFIFDLLNSPGWKDFIGDRNIHTVDHAAAYIHRIIDNPDIRYWVVKLKRQLTPIGLITLIKREYLEHHDMGFAFLPQFANCGYAFEASSVVLNILLNDHSTMLATTFANNSSSIKLLRKLGFNFIREQQEGRLNLHIYGVVK